MNRILAIAAVATLAACSTPQRYTAIATACDTYSFTLNRLSDLRDAGKLSEGARERISQTIPPARAICSGAAPVDNPAAVAKVADVISVLLKEATP